MKNQPCEKQKVDVSPDESNIVGLLWGVIGISLAIHVLCLILARTVFENWRWEHHPFHAGVEMAGSLIALFVALLLLSVNERHVGTSFNVWIAGALVGMGLLDGLHALVYAGQAFVWLHSIATFLGGVLFSMVWLPNHFSERIAKWWAWAAGAFAAIIGGVSLAWPTSTPTMLVTNGQGNAVFSNWAVFLNVAGGYLLVASSIKLLQTYFRHRNTDDLLFCLHAVLFGAAAIMFQQSELWDLTWWGWHLLRLMAYSVALWFLVLTIRKEQRTIARAAEFMENAKSELEQKVAERTRELTSLNADLNRSNRELEQFAYVASHDLQEPLRKIASYSDLLIEECGHQLDDEGHHFVGIIVDGSNRLRALVSDLLTFSRVTTHGRPLVPVRAEECLKVALDNLEMAIIENNAEITFDALPCIMADETQLTMLLQNLVGNGLKYRRDDRPCIHITANVHGEQTEFQVQDNGIGIEPQYYEQIFEIFKRLHGRQEFGGTGIGLAVCKRIVERFGGQIWVESSPGNGSTFRFTAANADHSEIGVEHGNQQPAYV